MAALLLLAIGLYYYLTSEHPAARGGGKGAEKRRGGKDGVVRDAAGGKSKATGNSKTAKSGGAKSSEAKAGTKKSQKKSKTEENKSSNQNKGGKSTKPKSKKKREVPTIPMSEVRLLRRPVPANDSDRPYIIEILNGDNLLLDERFSEALEKFNEILKMFPQSPRALFGKGETLSGLAKQKSSNKLMETAIDFYKDAANSFLAPKDIKVCAYLAISACVVLCADVLEGRGMSPHETSTCVCGDIHCI